MDSGGERLPEFQVRYGNDAFVFVIANGDLGVGEYMYSKQGGWEKTGMKAAHSIEVYEWMYFPEATLPPEVD